MKTVPLEPLGAAASANAFSYTLSASSFLALLVASVSVYQAL
jgi:hypothetical protein